jgi:RNA polymerase sigma factor (TIGR02999 family)
MASNNNPGADNTVKPVTQLLHAWQAGDGQALDQLMSLVYHELHRLAEHYMRSERPDHTLQPTSLVHEAYLRLVDSDVGFKDRVHFFAVSSTIMRRVLIDHARGKKRAKRAGHHVTLDEDLLGSEADTVDVIALDDALTRLAAQDSRKGRVIELVFFGGLKYNEVAEVLDISPATVERDLRMAKAWLYRDLRPNPAT